MANIRLNSLRTTPRIEGKRFIFNDLHLDTDERTSNRSELAQNPEKNDFKSDFDLDALRNSIYNIFTTSPGEKILTPEFGLNLLKYLFSPITERNADEIKRDIKIGIGRFEPRMVLINVSVVPNEDQNEYDITVEFDVPALNIRNQKLFGSLNQKGYIYKN
jgi:phage baseplate assembly protein W